MFKICFLGLISALWLFQLAVPVASAQNLKSQYVIGAIGDSISVAANASRLGIFPRYSWSTGEGSPFEMNSHYRRMAQSFAIPVVPVNKAVAGAVASDTLKQIDRLIPYQPDYVTYLIGGNDVCSWPANHAQHLAAFEQNVRKGIAKLVAHNTNIKILMLPIPDIMNLYDLGVERLRCRSRWNLTRICTPLLSRWRTPAQRLEFEGRYLDANRSLLKVAKEFSDNVKIVEEMANTQFERDDVSRVDCFHPSLKGQNMISKVAWDGGWFGENR